MKKKKNKKRKLDEEALLAETVLDENFNPDEKVKKKKKKNKDEDDIPLPPRSKFWELTNNLKSILSDLNVIEKQVTAIEMKFNPKPTPRPPPPKRPVSQKPSPTRNYFPPGVNQ